MNDLVRGSLGAIAAMFLVGTLAGMSTVINGYPLLGGQALRYALGAAILFAVARAKGLRLVRLSRRETLLLVALAATGLMLFNIFMIEGTRQASPAVLGTIVGSVPIVLAVIGPLTTGSRLSGRVLAAAFVVVAGAAVTSGWGTTSPAGALYALGALGCEACFSLLALPLLPKLGPVRLSAYTATAAVPMLLMGGAVSDGGAMLRLPTPGEAAGLLYLSLVVTTVAFFLWYDALPRLGADRAGLFAGVVPVGAIATTLVLGLGVPTAAELSGAALVIAGLALGLAPRREVRASERGRVVTPHHGRGQDEPRALAPHPGT